MKKIRRSFTASQKLDILKQVKRSNQSKVAKRHKIDQSQISRWAQHLSELENCNRRVRKIGSGRVPEHLEHEARLVKWIDSQLEQHKAITPFMIKERMQLLVDSEEFKGSYSWFKRFRSRWGYSMRDWTNASLASRRNEWKQDEEKEKVVQFANEYKEVIKGFDDSHIINMDETSVLFDMAPKRVLAYRGEPKVTIGCFTREGTRQRRVSCIFAVGKDGAKYTPALIIKGKAKEEPEIINGYQVWRQANSTMTSDLCCCWIEKCLRPQMKGKILLLMDSFGGHLTDDVRRCCNRLNILLLPIPPGCTKYLQPLDLTVNHSFKAKIRKEWIKGQWKSLAMLSPTVADDVKGKKSLSKRELLKLGDEPLEKTDENLKERRLILVKQIKAAWEQVTQTVVSNGFKVMMRCVEDGIQLPKPNVPESLGRKWVKDKTIEPLPNIEQDYSDEEMDVDSGVEYGPHLPREWIIENRKREARMMKAQHMVTSEIMAALNVSRSTVNSWCRSKDVEDPKKNLVKMGRPEKFGSEVREFIYQSRKKVNKDIAQDVLNQLNVSISARHVGRILRQELLARKLAK